MSLQCLTDTKGRSPVTLPSLSMTTSLRLGYQSLMLCTAPETEPQGASRPTSNSAIWSERGPVFFRSSVSATISGSPINGDPQRRSPSSCSTVEWLSVVEIRPIVPPTLFFTLCSMVSKATARGLNARIDRVEVCGSGARGLQRSCATSSRSQPFVKASSSCPPSPRRRFPGFRGSAPLHTSVSRKLSHCQSAVCETSCHLTWLEHVVQQIISWSGANLLIVT